MAKINIRTEGQSGGITAHTVNFHTPPTPPSEPPNKKPSWKKNLKYWLTVISLMVAILGYLGLKPKEDQTPSSIMADTLRAPKNGTDTASAIKRIKKINNAKRHNPKTDTMEKEKEGSINITSNNQTGGITAHTVNNTYQSLEDTPDSQIPNLAENFILNEDPNRPFFYKVQPKLGRWIKTFIFYPVKDSVKAQFRTSTGMMQSVAYFDHYNIEGVDYAGMIIGHLGNDGIPATHKFWYGVEFNKKPSHFIFGDFSNPNKVYQTIVN